MWRVQGVKQCISAYATIAPECNKSSPQESCNQPSKPWQAKEICQPKSQPICVPLLCCLYKSIGKGMPRSAPSHSNPVTVTVPLHPIPSWSFIHSQLQSCELRRSALQLRFDNPLCGVYWHGHPINCLPPSATLPLCPSPSRHLSLTHSLSLISTDALCVCTMIFHLF